MTSSPVRKQTRIWLRRHMPATWFVLTKSWWTVLLMLPLLYLLYQVVAQGYLDPDDGMFGVWMLGFMLSSACLVVLLLFISRSLCLELAATPALLKTLLKHPNLPETTRAKLQGFEAALTSGGQPANLRQILQADQPEPKLTTPSNSDQSVF
ncbi:hypothetical protein [Orrella sp. 11846]|uniref:hypothetical protein n=1 Tax=Orrella sp. 11846 TaxID=3409913 RepID=UPI003B5A9288